MFSNQVSQSGNIASLGMRTFLGLLQLLGITQQNNVPGRPRPCKCLRQRHLTGFVYEQIVQFSIETIRGPQPGRSSNGSTSVYCPNNSLTVLHQLQPFGNEVEVVTTMCKFYPEIFYVSEFLNLLKK